MSLFSLTARLRRLFPRHLEVLELCDEAERLYRERGVTKKPKRDRAVYMRVWRAKRRGG